MKAYSRIRGEKWARFQSSGSNSLPVRERGGDLFLEEDNDKSEIELYNTTRKEEANEIKRGGRKKEALNWAIVILIYVSIALAVLVLFSFAGAIAAGLYLENGQVHLNRVGAVYNSIKGIVKDFVLTIGIFVFGNKYEAASRLIRNVFSD